MAATARWDVPFYLETIYGTLNLNEAEGPGVERYLLVPSGCDMGAEIRSTTDVMPQADGSILHHRFETGYKSRLAMQLWYGSAPACNEDPRIMVDTLNLYVRSLLNAGDNEGRLYWTPDSTPNRMLDDIRLFERLTFSTSDTGVVVATFTVDTRFPYALNHAEETPNFIADSATTTLTNAGTTDSYPVFKVYGPASAFILFNVTTGELFNWDAALFGSPYIPGGQYAEVDMFANTIFLNGDEANLRSGIDMQTEYWPLVQGDNDVQVLITGGGPGADVLWASAWD